MSRHVHFVGSVGLDTAEQVFAEAGSEVGRYMPRCPDGEMGPRRMWISYQWPLLRANAYLKADEKALVPGAALCQMRVAPGANPKDIHFGELGYAREARYSYQLFLDARKAGKFAPDTRFQVSLPTPFAVIGAFIVQEDAPKVLPAYTAAMLREVEDICAHIPHKDLAIQWDVCIEMIFWDGRFPGLSPFPGMEHFFAATFKEIGNGVPDDVEMGIHLCYGDMDAVHFVQPESLQKPVELANLLARSARHKLAWVHMPVPADRTDEAYFKPLRELATPADAEVFLGVVHDDGIEGTKRRMAAAEKVRKDFGIATECGMARARNVETARRLFRIHAEAAA
jgi:methionine synthase II (cobalamin-independent)